MVLLQCFNKGCGRKFDPDDSSDVCVYHPANPFFHDAYKGWQCCNKKVTDFTEFLNIKGCATGRHNPEKPEANEQSLSNSKAVDCEKVEIPAPIVKRLPAERPKGIVEFRMLNISLSPSVEASLRNAQKPVLNKTCLQDDISSVAAGTVCKNAGCQYAFDGSSDHVQGECFYHSGLPIFHEGMKYWTCCQKKTSEFENFLNQPGCTKGVHKFSQEKKPVTCRYDWHQTAQFVTVAFYTKNVALDQSYIETNPFALKVHIDLDNEQESNVFDLLIPLWDEIDPLCSKATLYTTKLEVSLKKIEPTHWTSLESKNDTYSKISECCDICCFCQKSNYSFADMELQKLPDVPSVFVTHAAGDTREMERRLRTEVECKKEELRQMVGRRYRDIIEAADNIKQMKLCSDEVSQNLRTVQRGFEELQCLQNRMMGSYGNSTIAEVHWSVANNNNEVTAKLKLLMALSEQVYNYFDNGQMFHAVVLLKFCQHLNETLVAHPPDSVFLSSSKKLLDRLRTRLIKLCTNMLAEYNASNSHEAYEELEASFMLLENLSATGFLARFLELRKRSFELLCQDIACSSKDKICGAVWLIVQTMMVGLNVNMEKIAKLSAAASGPVNVMFKGLLEKFTTLYGVLPMSMFGRCFKILTAGIPIADTHDTSLTQQCRTWCSWATEALKLQMTSTLSFCDSLESVISLRSSCSDQLDKMVSDILKSFPDWHLEVERGFKSRIQELTAAQVLQIFDDVIVNVNENIAKWSQHSACCSYFLWSADCNNSSRQAADIELKVKGCNTSIYSFVDSFNSRLNSVRHQLETYVNVVYGTLDCNTSDAKEIWTSLSDASCAGIQMLVSAIHQQFDTISKNCSDAHEAAERILYCSKLCVALCDLCPQLKLCLGAQKALPQQSCGNWTLSKNILTACGTSGYRMWAKSVAALAMCHVFSGQVESSEFLSCEEQVTEILSVDEDCGDGQRLTSQFLLPIQCSVPIQTWLTEVSGFVCDAGAHSLPDACLVMLLLEILKCYLQYCVTAALKLSSETSRRKLAFQLVFDVRVLINLLSWTPTGSEEQLEHSRLVLESKSLLVSIESFLDPFDFEVVSPYLRQYIERFTTKFVNTYGCILPTALQAVLLRPSSAKRSAEGTQPYVPEVASQCNLFHVIAVPGMPDIKKEAKGSRKIDLFLPQSPKNQQSSRLSVASTMLQKSSSFYSGWFG